MWGYISTEASYQFNFNLGFATTRSDILIHLSQWQYWWWFWFTLVWSFYYLIMSRIVRLRVLKMRPKIVSSYRPHGKWGDFLACIIPMIWCVNILANSNFILRLIEWQNESSLFTVRVRARQWYWIYKFELKNFTDILSAPKNIGQNKWIVTTFGDLQVADDYLHILQLRCQNKWIKKYWSSILKNYGKQSKAHIVTPQEQFRLNLKNKTSETLFFSFYEKTVQNIFINQSNFNSFIFKSRNNFLNSNLTFNFNNKQSYYYLLLKNKKSLNLNHINNLNLFKDESSNKTKLFNNEIFYQKIQKLNLSSKSTFDILINSDINNKSTLILRNFPDFAESSRWVKKGNSQFKPFRLIKTPIFIDGLKNTNSFSSSPSDLFLTRFGKLNSKIQFKEFSHNPYLTLKQKRYKRRTTIPSIIKTYRDEDGLKTKKTKYSVKPALINNSFFENNSFDSLIQYKLFKKNKNRNDLIPVTLARRLLRTKKTLVLPSHINITLITNSYDIVHSWFIPGLGIKLDCVPGRSTHHTFYIDNVGFYYGQCAEICGRYHHHMPIRICALPFEHFLTWWHSFGLPKLLFTSSQKRYELHYSFRKFVW